MAMEAVLVLPVVMRGPVSDRIEVHATLISRYEDEHHPIDPPDPVDAILFRMDQAGLTRKDLEKAIGSRARVSDVLARRRELSKEMIRNLHAMLGIPLASLFGRRSANR